MDGIRVLDGPQTRAALRGDALTSALKRALIAIKNDDASCPPRIAAFAPRGLLGAMPGYVPELGLAAKLISVFDVGQPGQSAHQGIVASFDETTGTVRTVMDAAAVTAIRTAATATLAMEALAPAGPLRAAVIGLGTQGRAETSLLVDHPRVERVTVGVRHPEAADAGDLTGDIELTTVEAAVRGANVIFLCTGARTPVIQRSWLHDGAHVSSIGGSAGPEVDAATMASGSVFVEWMGAVTSTPPAGAHELQGWSTSQVTLLGSVLDGSHPGRRDDRDITVFKSTGHAALDVAAAFTVDTALDAAPSV